MIHLIFGGPRLSGSTFDFSAGYSMPWVVHTTRSTLRLTTAGLSRPVRTKQKKIRFSAQLFFMNGFLWNIGKTSQEGNPGVQKKVVSQQCLCQEEKYPMASENPICPIKNSVQPESLFGLQPKQSKHIC